MPRLPTILVIGSQAISTSWPGSRLDVDGSGMMVVIAILLFSPERLCVWWARSENEARAPAYQVRRAPVVSWVPVWRQRGSLSRVRPVIPRRLRITVPYKPDAVLESLPPGGSSMNGMNLSGKPGIVHPMKMPPTFGTPPMPLIPPRLGTLHFTTGPQHPSLTMHFGDPYSVAKSPCS